MNSTELANSLSMLSSRDMISAFNKMEQERSTWMKAITESQSLAEQMKKLVSLDTTAAQMAKQMYDMQKAQEDSVRKMLDPLANIRSGFLGDKSLQRMVDELSRPFATAEQFRKLIDQPISSAYLQSLNLNVDSSIKHAMKLLAEPSLSSNLQRMMKQYEATNKHWALPPTLLETMSPLKALQEQLGKLSLPVMDWASAATLARLMGSEGMQAQLAALGINPDGSFNPQLAKQEDQGVGLSRKTLDLMTLLGFILAILVPIYQEYSSAQWQKSTDNKLETQAEAIEHQRKMIEALSKLVEKALVQEASRQEQRFVVKERVAVVRSKPRHGAKVVGKLLPNEVVRPISEDGKWIEIEYYHWLHQEYRTGWALKKYFLRVARPDSDGED